MFGFINNFYLLIVLFIVARIVKTITTFFPNAIRVFEDFCTLPLNVSIDIGQLRLPIALTRWYLKHPSSSYHTNAGFVGYFIRIFLMRFFSAYQTRPSHSNRFAFRNNLIFGLLYSLFWSSFFCLSSWFRISPWIFL